MRITALTCAIAAGAGIAMAMIGMAPGAAAATPPGTVVATTPINPTPLLMDSTNGDLLAITKIAGAPTPEIAIGGNFTAVITPDGVSHPALNFAVVNQSTGAVLYAGSANSYVRAFASYAGTLYLGGDFTAISGVARAHVAALGPTFALQSFNPGATLRVRAVAADASGVYYGGDNAGVHKVNRTTGASLWVQYVSGGPVHALQLTPEGTYLFVGGLFETYGGVTQHGVIKALTSTGADVTAFNAHFKVDSGVGTYGSYDGEEGISFSLSPEGTYIVVGIGGHGTDEVRKLSITSGALIWNKYTPGDCQAVVAVGDTYVVGYHRNQANSGYPYPYFSAQLEGKDSQLTNWDPKITGNQSNADGGNNGVQAEFSDPVAKVLYVAGAFTLYNGVHNHQSLIAFSYS